MGRDLLLWLLGVPISVDYPAAPLRRPALVGGRSRQPLPSRRSARRREAGGARLHAAASRSTKFLRVFSETYAGAAVCENFLPVWRERIRGRRAFSPRTRASLPSPIPSSRYGSTN